MRIPHAALPLLRTVALLAVVALCVGLFGYLWIGAGGRIPLISQTGYRLVVPLSDVDNLVPESDVKQAGVDVGRVVGIDVAGDTALATVQLDAPGAAVHEGAVVRVRNKSLIEETYLEITDGTGAALPSGTTLPADAGRPSVQVDDLLADLDVPTREALGGLLRNTGLATAERRDDIARSVGALGDIGREGGDALTALGAQSADLRELVAGTTTLLAALDAQQGRVAHLVSDAGATFRTTAQQRADLEGLIRALPPLLSSAQEASGPLEVLAGKLTPVAENLRAAAPDVSAALAELPGTTDDLRELLPALRDTLDKAPATLDRVPGFGAELRDLAPTLQVNLSDVNPTLEFVAPYACDIGAFFTNFSASVGPDDGNGRIFRILFLFNEQTPNSPIESNVGPLFKRNSVPAPCTGDDPNPRGDAERAYPRVQEEPLPEGG